MSPLEKTIGLQALSGIANAHPLIKIAMRYWWLSLPSAFAFYTLVKARPKNTMATIIQDFSASFGPVVGLVILAEGAIKKEEQAASLSGFDPGNIKDASFKVQPDVTAGRMLPGAVAGTTPNFATKG